MPDPTLNFAKKCTPIEFLTTKKPLIGIHGIAGSFNDEALYRLTHLELEIPETDYTVKELIESKKVLEAVDAGLVDRGIFALANSGGGGVLAAVEAMGRHNYDVLALFTMPVNMNMLVHPSITSISQITEFTGHPIALNMCRKTLTKNYPTIPIKPFTDEMDTALSAKLLAEDKISPTSAIFASNRAAQIYGLHILAPNTHDDPNNATVFVLIKKAS